MRNRRIICTDHDPRWHDERRKLLTASGVAAMLGVGYDTAEEYLESKRPLPDGGYPEFAPNAPGVWPSITHGRFDEAHNMKKFSWITGLRSRSANVLVASTTIVPLGATIDGFVARPRDVFALPPVDWRTHHGTWPHVIRDAVANAPTPVGLLEMKQSSTFTKVWKASRKTGLPPPMYEAQVQAQLHSTGLRWGVLAAAIGHADMVAYYIERDDSDGFTQDLQDCCDRFAAEVLAA